MRISIVMPFRDAERYLDEALASLRADLVDDTEFLAIDDHSIDASRARIEAFAATLPVGRVHLLASETPGIVPALELGRRHARGRYLARMDADDVSLPGRLPAAAALLDGDTSLGAVGCRVEAFADEPIGDGWQRYVAWMNELVTPHEHARDRFVEAPLCHPSTVLRAEALAKVGGYRDGPFPEDHELWLRLVAHGFGLAKVEATLFRWRHRRDSATFRDPRYAHAAQRAMKAVYLAIELRTRGRAFVIWGAGPIGRRLTRALEREGLAPTSLIDIDPKKIGTRSKETPIVGVATGLEGRPLVVVAVGSYGARALILDELATRGFDRDDDVICFA